jgi:hypothetical protein
MATNRYDVFPQADFSFMEYQPEDFTPDLSMLDSLLGGLQQEWDEGRGQLKKIMPDYLRKSPEDAEAAKAFRAKYDQHILDIADAYASGDINAGRRSMKDAIRMMEEDQLPGGEYFELERRNKEYAAKAEEIRKTYKDNPRVAEYLISQIQIEPLRDPDTGNWGSIGSPSQMHADIPETDITGWFNTMLDNIKPTLLKQGWSKKQVDAITSIEDLKTMTGRQFNDIAMILVSSFPRQYQQSIAQRYTADLYHDPNTPQVNPTQVFDLDADGKLMVDDKGRAVFANTPLGNLFRGHVLAGTHVDVKDQLTKVKDDITLEREKSRLRKTELDHEFNLGREQYQTQVYTIDPGIPDWDLKVGDDGKIVDVKSALWLKPGFYEGDAALKASDLHGKGFKDYLQSDKAKENPALQTILGEFEDYIETLDNKKAYEFVKDQYEGMAKAMKTADAIYTSYGAKEKDSIEKVLIGDTDAKGNARIGNIRNMTIITQEPGKTPKSMTYALFAQEYGLTDDSFVKRASALGTVRSDNAIAPSGHKISIALGDKGKDAGKSIEIIASSISLQDAAFKSPEFTLQQARNNLGVDRTEAVFTGIPEVDETFGKVYAVGNTRFRKDLIEEELFKLYTNPGYRSDDPVWKKRVDDLENEKEKLTKNPKLNTFVRRQADLYSYDTDMPLVNPKTGEPLLTLDDIAQFKAFVTNPNKK